MSDTDYTEIVHVELPDGGGTIRAEVAVGAGDVSSLGDRLGLDEAQETIARVGRWAVQTVRQNLPEPPDEFEVQFGMKLALETGKIVSVLAKASGEASLTVRMAWNRDRPEPQGGQ
ncbi:CU044_2847 family protein [Streptomyces sp. fd1-xmd]|uniref:CU044_2847 family protein n=1 Tax=Streptomyces sp. fd1-xmd TaxID=1812480 RepID=UPI00135209E8|nr:CU044_2847 family protein [Streptomyces sp. fd1-xmd]